MQLSLLKCELLNGVCGSHGTALSPCEHCGIRWASPQLAWRVGERTPAAPLLGAGLAMLVPSQGPANGLCLSSVSSERGQNLRVVNPGHFGAFKGVGIQEGLGSCFSR